MQLGLYNQKQVKEPICGALNPLALYEIRFMTLPIHCPGLANAIGLLLFVKKESLGIHKRCPNPLSPCPFYKGPTNQSEFWAIILILLIFSSFLILTYDLSIFSCKNQLSIYISYPRDAIKKKKQRK